MLFTFQSLYLVTISLLPGIHPSVGNTTVVGHSISRRLTHCTRSQDKLQMTTDADRCPNLCLTIAYSDRAFTFDSTVFQLLHRQRGSNLFGSSSQDQALASARKSQQQAEHSPTLMLGIDFIAKVPVHSPLLRHSC